jgi:hypothetical protein
MVNLAASYGTPYNITAITNATEAVATFAAGHGTVVGDYIEITSGWSRLNSKIVRAKIVATNDVTLEGYDTTLTSIYPAGTGVGSGRRILTWTQLSQILTSTSSGGDQNFLDYQFLEADSQKRIPTFKAPAGLSFDVADDPTLAGYILAMAANDDRLPRAVRIQLPSAAKILYNAYISLNKTPSLTVNQVMASQVTLSLLAEPVRYAT